MGLVNAVVPLPQLEAETLRWCRRMMEKEQSHSRGWYGTSKSPLLRSCNEGHPGRHFGDGQPAGGRHAADGRLAPFRIVLNILGLLSPASVFAPPRS